VSSLPGPRWIRQTRRRWKSQVEDLPCEAVLGVSGEAWARGEAVVQVITQRKAIHASHSIGLSEWLPSQLLWIGGATAAMMMAGLTREQNVTFWRMDQCSGGLISQGIGDDQAESIGQDGTTDAHNIKSIPI